MLLEKFASLRARQLLEPTIRLPSKELSLHPKWLIQKLINMAIDDGQVRPSVVIGIQELSSETQRFKTASAKVRGLSTVPIESPFLRQVKRIRFPGEIRHVQIRKLIPVNVRTSDPHAGLSKSKLVESDITQDSFIAKMEWLIGARLLIDQQKIGGHVVRNENVQAIVLIEISDHQTQSPSLGQIQPALTLLFQKATVTQIEANGVECRVVSGRPTDGTTAVGVSAIPRQKVRPLQIIHVEQFRESIAVQIRHRATDSPDRLAQTGTVCHIDKRSVTVVTIEAVTAQIGDVQISETIIVKVASGDSLRIGPFINPRRGRDRVILFSLQIAVELVTRPL